MRYFVLHNKRQYGPFEETEIQELLEAGILTYNDPVAPEGTSRFQSMANTHLIFHKASPAVAHPPEDHSEDLTENRTDEPHPAIPGDETLTEAAAALEKVIVGIPEQSSASFWGKLRMYTREACTNLPQFVLTRVLSRKHLDKTIFGKALTGFISKIYAWLTLLAFSLLVQQFFFSKLFNALFKIIFPDAGPIGVSFLGQMAEMAIVLIACAYTLLTVALMTIIGADKLYEKTDFELKNLYISVHPRLIKFSLIILEFSLIIVILEMATVVLPDRIQFIGKYLTTLVFIACTNRILAVPFVAVLEELKINEAHRVSHILMQKQFKAVFKCALTYTIIEAVIDQLAHFWHYLALLKYLLQLFTLIFATYYYKDLSNRMLIRKRVRA